MSRPSPRFLLDPDAGGGRLASTAGSSLAVSLPVPRPPWGAHHDPSAIDKATGRAKGAPVLGGVSS